MCCHLRPSKQLLQPLEFAGIFWWDMCPVALLPQLIFLPDSWARSVVDGNEPLFCDLSRRDLPFCCPVTLLMAFVSSAVWVCLLWPLPSCPFPKGLPRPRAHILPQLLLVLAVPLNISVSIHLNVF